MGTGEKGHPQEAPQGRKHAGAALGTDGTGPRDAKRLRASQAVVGGSPRNPQAPSLHLTPYVGPSTPSSIPGPLTMRPVGGQAQGPGSRQGTQAAESSAGSGHGRRRSRAGRTPPRPPKRLANPEALCK